MYLAAAERQHLCDLLLRVGPEAPTLCDGWTARDLRAYLVLREGDPLASVGPVVPAAAGLTARAKERLAAQPYDALVDTLRAGPPLLSPFRLPRVGSAANLLEFYVHHEDVRRPADGGPRRDTPELDEPLWGRLRVMGRLLTRHARGLRVALSRRDGERAVIRGGSGPLVTVTGTPRELTVYLFDRKEVAEVDVTGDPAAVAALQAARLGL